MGPFWDELTAVLDDDPHRTINVEGNQVIDVYVRNN
jgi:hypothetical protein